MQKIEINLKSDWKIERISKIDLAILKNSYLRNKIQKISHLKLELMRQWN